MPRESHGQSSLAGYSPWGHKESDMTEVTYTHACTSCISKRRNEEDVLEFQRLAGLTSQRESAIVASFKVTKMTEVK